MSLSAYKAVDWDELDTTGAPNSSTVPTAMSDIVDYSWSVRDFNNNPVGTFPNGCKGPDAVWQAPQPAQGSCGQYFINLTVTDQKNANAGNGSTGSRADSVISFSRYIEVGSADYCH